MKRSLFFKIFSSFCLIILSLSILVFFFSFRTIKYHYINTLTLDLKNLAYTLKLKVLPLIEEKDFKKLDSLAKEIGKNIKTRITIIAPSGKVLADSEKNPEFMENHNDRPEVRQAKIKGFGKSKGQNSEDAFQEGLHLFVKRIKLELVVHDEIIDEVVDTIQKIAHTGNPGDGKIFITDVDNTIKIRTNERGEEAI